MSKEKTEQPCKETPHIEPKRFDPNRQEAPPRAGETKSKPKQTGETKSPEHSQQS